MSTRYIPMAEDEELWIVKTESGALAELLDDPGTWIEDNAPEAEPSMSGHYFIEFSTSTPSEGGLVVKGMSGTALVIVTGHDDAIPTFGPGVGMTATNLATFWENLDAALATHLEFPNIEFFILRETNSVFVHLQINPDRGFLAMMMSAVAQDQVGFLNWLQDTSGVVPRELREIAKDGDITMLPMSSLRINPRGTTGGGGMRDVRMFFENLSGGLCPDEFPNLVACEGAEGPIISSTPALTVAELDLIFLKAYCVEEVPEPPNP
ncbi:MAG: hypothetical protein JNJ45_06185 [Chthonomonas sp.]|nr:hypothetical protein [Chthonomonas sp.]